MEHVGQSRTQTSHRVMGDKCPVWYKKKQSVQNEWTPNVPLLQHRYCSISTKQLVADQ